MRRALSVVITLSIAGVPTLASAVLRQGPEFQINTYTTGSQTARLARSVASGGIVPRAVELRVESDGSKFESYAASSAVVTGDIASSLATRRSISL
jgi:hypothetical protein